MQIYLTVNVVNKKWYIGQDKHDRAWYLGSGTALKRAIQKYGRDSFKKFILATCNSKDELNKMEIEWIQYTGAVAHVNSYNIAKGGNGGPGDKFRGAVAWYNSLSRDEQQLWHATQAKKRTKGWYVSKVDSLAEVYVQNISKWCEENGVDKSMPSKLNNPSCPLFQKQTKGWRIRRADMPKLELYVNKRKVGHENIACKGKTWQLVNGKREWFTKETI